MIILDDWKSADILAYIDKRIVQYKARNEKDAAMALGVLYGDLVAGFHEREAAPAGSK